jgi:ATP-dependent helicase/nuclease subunit A
VIAQDDARAIDAHGRRVAQTRFDRPLLVQAGAGTGKTRVLVGRLVAWCMGPGWDERATDLSAESVAARALGRVVAITFTEAAAAEMASRVALTLRAVRDGDPPLGFEEGALPEARDERGRRAAALLATLDRLTVSTIHAWCRALLAEHAFEAGLDPRFEVDANETRDAEVVRAVVERFLREALAQTPSPALLALSRHGIGPATLERALLDLVRAGALPELLEPDPFDPTRLRRAHASLASAVRGLDEAAGALREQRGGRTRSAAAAVGRTVDCLAEAPRSLAELEALRDRLRYVWDDPKDLGRLRDWSRGRFTQAEDRALGERRSDVEADGARAHTLLVHLLDLDPPLLVLLCGVLRPLLADVQRELRASGVQTYAALLRDASLLVERHPTVTARVRGGIDQLMVDEFQDTDVLQCSLLRRLALEGPAEERPVLFVVGDPKQSIYGWRNADLLAFHRFRSELMAGGGEVLSLSVNFRSPPVLLEEVRRVVAPAMQEEPGVQPPFEALWAAPALADHPGFEAPGRSAVEHWISWDWDAEKGEPIRLSARAATELEARAVANDLVELHEQHGVAWSDVALLFRGTGDLETYLGALREADVPCVVERDRSYHRRREILDAGALVRCLLDPNDQVALVAWLRSPAVGVPDAALLPLWRAQLPTLVRSLHGIEEPFFVQVRACVEAAAREVPPDVPGLERIEGWELSLLAALEALAVARASFDRDPADVFVERVRELFAVEALEGARYLGAYRAANLDRFFRHLVEALEHCGGNVSTVLAELRGAVSEAREETEGRPKDADEDAVQVMTIHRAKGLDFEHVYLLQHHKGRGRGAGESAAGMHAPGTVESDQAPAEYWLASRAASTLGFGEAELVAREVERAELVRTLYVATTRARRRLVVAGAWVLGERRPLAAAETHAALLAHRQDGPSDLRSMMTSLVERGEWCVREGSALWKFPALRPPLAPRTAAPRRDPSRDRVSFREQSRVLRAARAAAEARAELRTVRAASAEASSAEVLSAHYRDATGVEADPPRQAALAVGSAVHRALEELEPSRDPKQDAAICLEVAARALSQLDGAERDQALASAREVIEAFVAGPLYARFLEIAPRVLARELPVLASPDAGKPGVIVGTLDLVYRDPLDDTWVVVDYKTDRVEGEAAHDERARGYLAQGAVYQRSIQEALGLPAPPRFELWFLRSGRVVPPTPTS